LSLSSIKAAGQGIRLNRAIPDMSHNFFYGTTLGQKEIAEQIPYARKQDTLPAVLTPDEVVRLLKAEANLKMRTALIASRAGAR
jgi:integrase